MDHLIHSRSRLRDVMLPKPKRWYEGEGRSRLIHDRKLLADAYPDLRYVIDGTTGQVYIVGLITIVAECGVPTEIAVRIDFPADYPEHEPLVYDAGSRFPHIADRHFLPDGQCCLWLPPKSRWNPDDPDGLYCFLNEVVVFFDQQLVCEAEGKGWPGNQWSHGEAGYIEFVLEKLGGDYKLLAILAPIFAGRYRFPGKRRCPCGSGLKYKKCHQGIVQEISQQVGPERLRIIFQRHTLNSSKAEK